MEQRNKKKQKVRLLWPHLCHESVFTIELSKRDKRE